MHSAAEAAPRGVLSFVLSGPLGLSRGGARIHAKAAADVHRRAVDRQEGARLDRARVVGLSDPDEARRTRRFSWHDVKFLIVPDAGWQVFYASWIEDWAGPEYAQIPESSRRTFPLDSITTAGILAIRAAGGRRRIASDGAFGLRDRPAVHSQSIRAAARRSRGIIGARRACTVSMISALSIPCR